MSGLVSYSPAVGILVEIDLANAPSAGADTSSVSADAVETSIDAAIIRGNIVFIGYMGYNLFT